MDPAWVIAALSLISAVIGLLVWAGRWAWRILSRTTRFLDDYFGEPEHDGLPAKRGVQARLYSLETMVSDIHKELHPNGGDSMRDTVNQTARSVATLAGRVELFESERKARDD